MDELIPSFARLIEQFSPCFRTEVFQTFRLVVGAWIVCLGPRNISRVWETTGQALQRPHVAAYRLFSEAAWVWDELGAVLATLIVAHFIPGGAVWVVVDDTLCHKRGAKVAFGGIFLDAVLSSKGHKVFRFGNNWVMLGLVVRLPFRERYFCLPVLWRVYEKRGKKKASEHRSKGQLAGDLVRWLAERFPTRKIVVVGDSAYVGKHLLKQRPGNVDVLGPMRADAALFELRPADPRGRRRRGSRLPTPKAVQADDQRWPTHSLTLTLAGRERTLEIKLLEDVCWPRAAGNTPVRVLLVRDPQGTWRNEVLVTTQPELTPAEMIAGYCRRWSIEVAFGDAKQLLGFHDPQVWCAKSVERAAPLAWFLGSLTIVWYALSGHQEEPAARERPWYRQKVTPTFSDMLATLRKCHWEQWLAARCGSPTETPESWAWLVNYMATAP